MMIIAALITIINAVVVAVPQRSAEASHERLTRERAMLVEREKARIELATAREERVILLEVLFALDPHRRK